MKIHRLRSVVHPGDRTKDALVTSVRAGGAVLGANVWHKNQAVFVRVEDLESVGRELLRLAEKWKKS